MHDSMSVSQAGYLDYGFLGAAQIDAFGNINTTVIGDWQNPRVRFPGSGGANDVASFCHQTILILEQNRRRFVKKVDFLTSPGYLDGPGAREQAGLPARGGPYRVITQLGVYGFDPETKKMMLVALHPGVSTDDVTENSAFEIIIPDQVDVTDRPTEKELRLLREEIDPTGMSIGK